jgi:hypothetical protein
MARDRSRMHMIDAVWLDVEQDDAPIAVGAVMEFSGRAPAITRVRQRIAEVIPLAPRLSQVPEASWDGLRQPKWVDVEVDLEVHVQRETVADLEAGSTGQPRACRPSRSRGGRGSRGRGGVRTRHQGSGGQHPARRG